MIPRPRRVTVLTPDPDLGPFRELLKLCLAEGTSVRVGADLDAIPHRTSSLDPDLVLLDERLGLAMLEELIGLLRGDADLSETPILVAGRGDPRHDPGLLLARGVLDYLELDKYPELSIQRIQNYFHIRELKRDTEDTLLRSQKLVDQRTSELKEQNRILARHHAFAQLHLQLAQLTEQGRDLRRMVQGVLELVGEGLGFASASGFLWDDGDWSNRGSVVITEAGSSPARHASLLERRGLTADGAPIKALESGGMALHDHDEDSSLHVLGIRQSLAMLVRVRQDPVAVLEFYDTRRRGLDQDLREFLAQVQGYLSRVAERQRMSEDQGRLVEQLHEAQHFRSLGKLTALIAHDFRNLLTALGGHIELAREAIEHGEVERVPESLAGAMESVQHGTKLVQRISSFQRGEGTEFQLHKANSLAQTCAVLVASHVDATHRWELELSPSPCRVRVDPTQIQQVLLNLCRNAFEAIDRDGGTVRLSVGNRQFGRSDPELPDLLPAGRYACFQVSDDGVGMDEDTLAQIFEPSYSTKLAVGGSGLGLVSTLSIIRAHRGGITVKSELGKGSQFEVFLPLVENGNGETKRDPDTAPHLSILLVDDNARDRELGVELLRHLGHRVEACDSGPDALSVLDADPDAFDVVFTDHVMPGMSGTEFGQLLRNRSTAVPLVIMSGDIRVLEAEDFDAVIIKPFDLAELAQTLQKVMHWPGEG